MDQASCLSIGPWFLIISFKSFFSLSLFVAFL
ncbi:putative membrane protein, partial [Acinetobacter baumannii 6112]